MSLRQLQTRNFLEFIVSSYLVSGKKPTDTEVFKALNFYFSQQPAGSPISLQPDLFRRATTSNVDDINDFMASVQVNLQVLFDQLDQHIDQNLLLSTVLTSQMKMLRSKRKRMISKVDDILLGVYNSDGFFNSVSDDFYDALLVDFNYTNAFVDIEAGTVALPTDSDGTKVLNLIGNNEPNISASLRRDITSSIPYIQETNFDHAVDGLSNTAWYIKLNRVEPSDGVFVKVSFDVASKVSPTEVDQITITPHGVEPVQCAVKKIVAQDQQSSSEQIFSSVIKTSAEKMVFVNEDKDTGISRVIFEFTKSRPDYFEDNIDGSRSGVYIIGIRELMITQQTYDAAATLVSQPFGLSDALAGDQVIGSVSLTVEQSKPVNTDITYFIAPDDPDAVEISDFSWREIEPISSTGSLAKNSVIDLGGAYRQQLFFRNQPRFDADTQLTPLNSSTADPQYQNPSPAMFQNFDVYRVGKFQEDFLSGTIVLEEGINTTKIFYTDFDDDNIDDTFNFWKAKFDSVSSYQSTYGEIDVGNGFFYGADVGENDRSVYVETFVYSDIDQPVVLRDIVKGNPNSKLWNMKAFLNGREIAKMPIGIDRVRAPFKINRGRNSIILVANIPPASNASLVPYIGSVELDLLDYGTVKLGDLTYADNYKFKDNGYRDSGEVSPNKWFTIHNNEIVTRSKLTDNYRLRYASPTGGAPDNIRLRAELRRYAEDSRVSPILDSYRVRFSYLEDDER